MDERVQHRAFRALLLAHAYPGSVQAGPAACAEDTLSILQEAVWADAPQPPLLLGERDASAELAAADRGSELTPERGRTVVRLVPAGFPRLQVTLRGPGVREPLRAALPLRASELAARDSACGSYPLGIDLVFLEANGSISALPRTVQISAVEGT